MSKKCVVDTGLDSDLDHLSEEEKELSFDRIKKAAEMERMIKQAKQ
jgi:hypothetical protein